MQRLKLPFEWFNSSTGKAQAIPERTLKKHACIKTLVPDLYGQPNSGIRQIGSANGSNIVLIYNTVFILVFIFKIAGLNSHCANRFGNFRIVYLILIIKSRN